MPAILVVALGVEAGYGVEAFGIHAVHSRLLPLLLLVFTLQVLNHSFEHRVVVRVDASLLSLVVPLARSGLGDAADLLYVSTQPE